MSARAFIYVCPAGILRAMGHGGQSALSSISIRTLDGEARLAKALDIEEDALRAL